MPDNQKIVEARCKIRRVFDELPIFERSRQSALYNFCAVLEVRSMLAMADPAAVFQTGRDFVEATIQAIPAIFDKCHPGGENDLAIHRTAYEEAYELFFYARDLEQVTYCFELVDRGQYDVRLDTGSGTIMFNYASEHEADADTRIRSSEISSRIVPATAQQVQEIQELALAAKEELQRTILFTGLDSITYNITPALKLVATRWAAANARAEKWYFPDSFVIGQHKIGDIRIFWGAIQTLVNLHDGAHLLVSAPDQKNWPIGSAVHLRSTTEWSQLLSEISPLSVDVAAELLSWYTFDKGIAGTTPSIQPFLEVSPGYLALPSASSTTSSKERNLLKLLNRHPKLRRLAGQLKDSKEDLALEDIRKLFPPATFTTEQTVVIEGVTDADLVIYERSVGFVLVIQHKWLIEPDTLKESSSNDEELSKGIAQAIMSRDALRANPDLLRKGLKLSMSDPLGPIEAVVISRGAEPTGFVSQAQIPVVEEEAFRGLFDEHHSLESLYAASRSRPDHVEASKLYRDATRSFELGDYRFSVPVLAK